MLGGVDFKVKILFRDKERYYIIYKINIRS